MTSLPRARMKILMPREAWPSAMPCRLRSESCGVNSIAPSAFSGTATTTTAAARCTSPARVSTSTPSSDWRTAATGVARRTSTGAAWWIACSSETVPSFSVTRPPVYCVSRRL